MQCRKVSEGFLCRCSQSMVTGDPLPRAALSLLSSVSGVMTLCFSPLEGSPAAHLLSWQSRRFSFVLCCVFTFHGEVKAPKVAAALHGVMMKQKLFSISHMQGHHRGGGGAQAPCWSSWLLSWRRGGERSNASLIFGSRSLKFLFITWSSNTLLVCSWRGSSPATSHHLKGVTGAEMKQRGEIEEEEGNT